MPVVGGKLPALKWNWHFITQANPAATAIVVILILDIAPELNLM